MIKSVKVKKTVFVFLIVLFIVVNIFAYPICISLFTAISGDRIIYEHQSSKFLFCILDISDNNELIIEIDYYKGRDFLELNDPFFYGEFPREAVTEYVELPEEYDIKPENCLRDEKGFIQSNLFKSQLSDYGLSKFQADFRVDSGYCNPELLELKDGRQFVVYKKFNYLFLHEVDKD